MDAADWKAPPTDGGILVSPGLDQLVELARENQGRLRQCSTLISGKPLHLWRNQMRQILGHVVPDPLLICCGHQAELYHPGVWIKLVLIDRLARATNGRAMQFSVDSDAPKHLQLRWPQGAIDISPRAASAVSWAGRLPPPASAHLQTVLNEIQRIIPQWNFQSLLPTFLRLLIETTQAHSNLPSALAMAMQHLDNQLGLSYELCMSEPIWSAEPYLAFILHMLTNADEFATCYNHALVEYRRKERIKSPGRPMPDLERDDSQIELPFWLDDLSTGHRTRLTITRTAVGAFLHSGRSVLEFSKSSTADLAQFCTANNLRIAPRALTLTMFLRLFVCDQWIHGIGGARYDQVTDQIIRDFFHIDPPAFGVATATLYFPSAATRQRTNLSAIEHTGHQLKHRVLGPAKTSYLKQIDQFPRHSSQRAETFSAMHGAMNQTNSPELAQWNKEWPQAQLAAVEERDIFNRELFYGIQSSERLNNLSNQIR